MANTDTRDHTDDRKWTDQPAFLADATSICDSYIGNCRSIQVMKHKGLYYVTVGNLFSSGTVRVVGADEAIEAIGIIAGLGEDDTIVAARYGWTVIPNHWREPFGE